MYNMDKRVYENDDYAAMLRRLIDAYGRRLADGSPEDLAKAVELHRHLDKMMDEAVPAMRERYGWSWAEIARPLGMARENAYKRWGKRP